MSMDRPERGTVLLLTLLLLVPLVVFAEIGDAQARPLPEDFDIVVDADCSVTLTWTGGKGMLFVRVNLSTGTGAMVESHWQRVHAKDGSFTHTWASQASPGYQVTGYLWTAKGKDGASGDFLDSVGGVC